MRVVIVVAMSAAVLGGMWLITGQQDVAQAQSVTPPSSSANWATGEGPRVDYSGGDTGKSVVVDLYRDDSGVWTKVRSSSKEPDGFSISNLSNAAPGGTQFRWDVTFFDAQQQVIQTDQHIVAKP